MPSKYAAEPADVRRFVLRRVVQDGRNLASDIQNEFGVSRPTAHNYIRHLIGEGLIERRSPGRYDLGTASRAFEHVVKGLEEHEVWTNELQPVLGDLPSNVREIWHYGCTEMINNVIDHSESPTLSVAVERTALYTEIIIHDEGVGIFRKIARALQLDDDRHAVLELSKGKVTTDPENHSGEGIFFSSRAFDHFRILSGDVYFEHKGDDDEDWILGQEIPTEAVNGTSVIMTLQNDSDRRIINVFDAHATDTEDYRFDRTVVPVKLLEYGDEQLVSRSQAKRLLTRFDRFRVVVLDFADVKSIGQAFADELFRVFTRRHPEIELIPINSNEQVTRMISRARSGDEPQRTLFGD